MSIFYNGKRISKVGVICEDSGNFSFDSLVLKMPSGDISSSGTSLLCAGHNSLYAGYANSKYLIKSTDNGNTWQNMVGTNFLHNLIECGDNLLMCVNINGDLYRSFDEGATWELSSIQAMNYTMLIYIEGVWMLFHDGSEGAFALRSIDNGDTWQEIELPKAESYVTYAYHDGILIASSTLNGSQPIISFDKGITWQELSLQNLTTSDTRMPMTHTGEKFIILSWHGNKVWQSVDGIEWDYYLTSGVSNMTARWMAYGEGILAFASASDTNVYFSTDDGLTWEEAINIASVPSNICSKILFYNNRFLFTKVTTNTTPYILEMLYKKI